GVSPPSGVLLPSGRAVDPEPESVCLEPSQGLQQARGHAQHRQGGVQRRPQGSCIQSLCAHAGHSREVHQRRQAGGGCGAAGVP
ncbi:unnamed protein product, partial [Ectocarpus sp. 8 AP-2014]